MQNGVIMTKLKIIPLGLSWRLSKTWRQIMTGSQSKFGHHCQCDYTFKALQSYVLPNHSFLFSPIDTR